ncbi:hypothetical protein C8R46DRAFT_1114753 [Mycena filopes]|nr:hypothetical protein C8R46DRAFT_1114753 [Mycena filopes]
MCSQVYRLSVTAAVSARLDVPLSARASPAAILDEYMAQSGAPAPAWMDWEGPRFFDNGRPSFIGMFVEMAMWPSNLRTPNLAMKMIRWAQTISTGTWAESARLGPVTPRRPTVARNRKPRRLSEHDIEPLRTPTRKLEGNWEEGECSSDDERDASLWSSIAEYPLEPLAPLSL